MKFTVVQIGAKQYKVSEGDILEVEKIEGKPKAKLTFDKLLLISDKDKLSLGQPHLSGAKLTAEIIDQFKAKKIRAATYKAKSRYRKVKGHRQQLTKIKILKITQTSKTT